MEYEKLSSNRIDHCRFDPENKPVRCHVNILLVDKTQGKLFPYAFQFNHDFSYSDDLLNQAIQNYRVMNLEAFMMLGEVDLINRKDKLVLLRDGNTVVYKHLIVISDKTPSFVGSLSQEKEYNAALNSLIDALRVKHKVDSNDFIGRDQVLNQTNPHFHSSRFSISTLPISHVFLECVTQDLQGSISNYHCPSGKRLYEIQL